MGNATDSKGRIVYFEPNELFGDDNQPVNQEDLTKYVNLSVSIPSRNYELGGNRKKYDSILQGRRFEEKINGKDYTKFYLTDDYVNVSYTEFGKDGQISNGELFGVESINISFDVQFQPIVVINFVDVRGMGLMSTMEHNYSEGGINNLTAKSFFTSLFNFPYPIFTLEVKGYYGKSISFDLALKDFHTAFDSTTGNFKTSVSFIGHLYGVYGDIPMSFIMASPYFDYKNSKDNIEECTGETWRRLGKPEIPTYIGLLKSFKDIIGGKNLNGETDTLAIYQTVEREKNILENVENIYKSIIELAESELENLCYDGQEKYINCTGDNKGRKLSEKTVEYENVKKILSKFLDKKEQDSKGNYIKGGFIFPYKKDSSPGGAIVVGGENVYYNYTNDYEANLKEEFKLTIIDISGETINIKGQEYKLIAFVDIYEKLDSIKKRILEIEREIKLNKEKVSNVIIDIVTRKIGFRPSIKNLYQMLFKHLNCFSNQFFTTISNINTYRNKSNLNINGNYLTDIVGYEGGAVIPPFPMFATKDGGPESKHRIIYPGEIEGFHREEEISMVENIYESLKYFTEGIASEQRAIEIAYTEEIDGREINLKKGNFFADLDPNVEYKYKNYFTISEDENDYSKAEKIQNIFLQRLATFSRTHPDKMLDTFINVEVDLIENSHPNMNNETLLILDNLGSVVNDVYDTKKKTNSIGNESELDNSKIESIIRIYANGDRHTCKTAIDQIQINGDMKVEFDVYKHEDLYEVNWSELLGWHAVEGCPKEWVSTPGNPLQSGYYQKIKIEQYCKSNNVGKFNQRMKLQLACSGSESGRPVSCGDGECRWAKTAFFRKGETIYVDKDEETKLFDWACKTYYKEKVTIKSCPHNPSVFESDKYYTIPSMQNGNKIALISLAHLLAIGEMLINRPKIPLTLVKNKTELGGNLSIGKGFNTVYGFTPCTEVFGDYCKGLYRYFFNKDVATGDDEKYNYFTKNLNNVTRGDIKKACDTWFVIGREVVFNGTNINEIDNKTWEKFINELFSRYGAYRDALKREEKVIEQEKEIVELKTNIYYTLKTLYDKWFCGLNRDFFDMYQRRKVTYDYTNTYSDLIIHNHIPLSKHLVPLKGEFSVEEIKEDSEFNKIKYLTTTFNDISENLIVDIEAFANQILSIKENPDNVNVSVLSYMAKTAQDNQSTFLVLPTNIFDQNLKDAFGTYNFYDGTANHDEHGSTYVVMYNGDVSHILDNSNSEYTQDGFTIADYRNGELEITEEAAEIMAHEVESGHNYIIQAFGVTYGMQNQNIFRNISVDTQTPQVTDYSIANMLTIAEQGSGLANGVNMLTKVQSLYPVYANRSYNCTVEMMGCMNISPLMYFQLNNIPMFKGAYMITNVEHRITANDFVTTFTGVRVSKYNVPINREVINISKIGTISTDGMNLENVGDWISLKPTTELVTSKPIGELTFNTIDPNNDYWFPYSGATIGREIGGNIYHSYDDDCLASVRKSIAMMVTADYNADSSTKGTAYHFTNPTNVVQLLYEKDGKLYYVDRVDVNDEGNYQRYNRYIMCRNYMEKCLNNGYPVCVGVTHSIGGSRNKDKTTNHWLCVYAYAKNNNKTYFKFYESGSNHKETCISNENILIFEENVTTLRPVFYCEKKYKNKRYDVSQVRINKTLNYDFINNITQPYQEPEKFEGNTEYLYRPNK